MYVIPKLHPRPISPFDKEVAGKIDTAVNERREAVSAEALAFVGTEPTSDRARPLKHAAHLVNRSKAPDMRG